MRDSIIQIGPIELGLLGSVLLVVGLLGVIVIGVDRIFTAAGLAIAYLSACGWLLLVIFAVAVILVVLKHLYEE